MEVVVDNPVTLVQLGDLSNPLVLLGCATFIAIIVLEKMNVKGNIIIGILVFSIIAWVADLSKFNGVVGSIPPMKHLFTFLPLIFFVTSCSIIGGPNAYFPEKKYDFLEEEIEADITLPTNLDF